MGKILKPGRIVIMLCGRFAGRKAVVVKNFDNASNDRTYPHALVAGLDRYPKRITRKMSVNRQKKRLRIRPFLKVVNQTHLMPTRYILDTKFDAKLINKEILKDKLKKRRAKNEIKSKLNERLVAGRNLWFFTKLHF